ncbi:MAG: DUF2127 domain-containing protein [Nitrospiraceae bacterium]|nr:DUF2127 domain-containing protein [Nitrospiraceae bacterium]
MMKSPSQKRSRKVLHETFEIGIVLKGIDGLFEIIGGVLLLFTSPGQINRLLLFLLRHELSEDPRDLVANFLLRAAGQLSVGSQLFGSLYLLSHGIVKAAIVISLWRMRFWAYPAAIVFFAAFIAYQLYRYTYSHSFWLIVLSVFDAVVVVLTWIEYRHVKTMGRRAHHAQ